MRQLLSDHQKIKKIEGNLFKCVNDYDLFPLKIEHKNQCIMQVSQDRTMDEYL